MTNVEEILEFNRKFVEDKKYELYSTTRYPNKKIAILSCMDTRLTELLPAALNFKNGDIKIIKNAGAMINHPFGSVMRSILVAIFELGVQDIMVIGHHDCGMQGLRTSDMINKMLQRNIQREKIDMIRYCGVDIERWLNGFDSVEESILETVGIIEKHPLVPADVLIHGFIIDPTTGLLTQLT